MARFFREVCRIVCTKNVYTKTYNIQFNGQVEWFNRTKLSALRKYLGGQPCQWDRFTDELTYEYNTPMHRTSKSAQLNLVLSRTPENLALEVEHVVEDKPPKDTYI